ncbi:hypothetical protein WG909_07430 [Peptostreptococcaceae bacterium AGR-M142]
MNGGLTDYMKNKIMNLMFRNEPLKSFENIYIGLFDKNPLENGIEINKSGYHRVSANFINSNAGEVTNEDDILFGVSTEAWGEVRFIGVFDKEEEGNLIWYGEFEFPKVYDISDQMKIPQGAFTMRIS